MNLTYTSHLTASTETLEDWEDSPTSKMTRLKSASLPKSLSKSDLWEGLQRKSQDFLKGTGMLMRSNSKDDSPNQVLCNIWMILCDDFLYFSGFLKDQDLTVSVQCIHI